MHKDTTEEKLTRLKKLYEKGAITEEIYLMNKRLLSGENENKTQK